MLSVQVGREPPGIREYRFNRRVARRQTLDGVTSIVDDGRPVFRQLSTETKSGELRSTYT
jgi:hypothetical protein